MYCRKTFDELLDVKSVAKPFSFRYDGEMRDLSQIPCSVEAEADGLRRVIYEVVPGVLRLTLEMKVWPDFPVVEYTPYFENVSENDSGVISEISVLDYETEDPAFFGTQKLKQDFYGNSRLTVRYFLGSKAAGSDFLPQRRDLFSRPGCNKLELECSEPRCSTDFLPFIAIDNDAMNGLNLAIGWTGAWKFSVEKEITSNLWGAGRKSRIKCGMKQAAFRLHPGERVMQPGVLLHFREEKSIRYGQNEFRRFMKAHHSPRNSRGELFKPPVSLALWGGLETERQLERIKVLEEEKLPYEELWIDAGWMGAPGPCPHFLEDSPLKSDWPSRVGSWEFNTWAHPNGLRPIADAAHKAGLRLMVWFEALRVHSASGGAVLKEHPEWLLGDHASAAEGKNVEYLLNIGIPEARKYLIDTIGGIIEREGIDDYREDFNLSAQYQLACGDEPERIGITEMKFVEGAYLYWEELRRRFPDMFIDNCASGGRRLDYKTASFSFPLCQSDFATFQVYEEECVQLENLYLDDWLPLHGTLNWGPDDTYHALSGLGCGYGSKIWQFNGREPKKDHDYELHRKIISWGRELRDMRLAGDVYPLVDAPENDWDKWLGVQLHDHEHDCGMVQLFRRKRSTMPEYRLNLIGLEQDSLYKLEFFTGETQCIKGKELASLAITLDSPRSAQILKYTKIK